MALRSQYCSQATMLVSMQSLIWHAEVWGGAMFLVLGLFYAADWWGSLVSLTIGALLIGGFFFLRRASQKTESRIVD